MIELQETYQKPGETVGGYVRRLRDIASICEYDKAKTEGAIILQLCKGALDQEVRKEAFKANITLDDVIKYATRHEKPAGLQGIVKSEPVIVDGFTIKQEVNAVNHRRGLGRPKDSKDTKSKKKCFKCGGSYSHEDDCPAKGKSCNECGGIGHFAKYCRNKEEERAHSKKKKIRVIDEEEEDKDQEYLFSVGSKRNTPRTEIVIGDSEISMMIDSGASVTIIDEETFNNMKPKPNIKTVQTKLYPFGKGAKAIDLIGEFESVVKANQRACRVTVRVVKGKTGCVLDHVSAERLWLYDRKELFKRIDDDQSWDISEVNNGVDRRVPYQDDDDLEEKVQNITASEGEIEMTKIDSDKAFHQLELKESRNIIQNEVLVGPNMTYDILVWDKSDVEREQRLQVYDKDMTRQEIAEDSKKDPLEMAIRKAIRNERLAIDERKIIGEVNKRIPERSINEGDIVLQCARLIALEKLDERVLSRQQWRRKCEFENRIDVILLFFRPD